MSCDNEEREFISETTKDILDDLSVILSLCSNKSNINHAIDNVSKIRKHAGHILNSLHCVHMVHTSDE